MWKARKAQEKAIDVYVRPLKMMVRTRGLPPQGSHRSVLAQLTHTAPHLIHTLPWRRLVVTLTQPPASMDRPCFPPKLHETLPPSLPRLP